MKKRFYSICAVLVLCICLTSCKGKENTAVMKELNLNNNIAYNYVVSSALSTADGFAKDLAVVNASEPNTDDTVLSCGAAILVDITDNDIIFKKNIFDQLYPASTTKVMTTLVALENGDFSTVYTIPEPITWNEDNVWICDFRQGDILTLEQAAYGAIINSGNDAAKVVADIVAGDEASFANLMNYRALSIGATGSHFANPHGLTNPAHYVTAYDMYLIFNEAIKNPKFLEMCSTVTYSTSFTRRTYTINPSWTNGNQFINGSVSAPEGIKVIGGKTGYTQAAGYCLVILSEAPTTGHRYISVILNATSKSSLYNQMSYLLEKIPLH